MRIVWLPGNAAASLPSSSPQFWFGNELHWSVIARVGDQAYSLFGVSDTPDDVQAATVTKAEYTSTHSVFTLEAGSKTFTLDFLSPVSPQNLLRQSLPFSYLTVSVSGDEEKAVQIYSDIDSSWTGKPKDAEWGFATNGSTAIYNLSPADGVPFHQTEEQQALWGETIYASRPSKQEGKLSTASGSSSTVRSQFLKNGTLDGQHADWSADGVVGLAHDLGKTDDSVVFAIGHVREQVINYLGNAQAAYYFSEFSDGASAVAHFLDDYTDATTEASKLDELVQKGGESSHSSNYSDILALSVRQTFGGVELTVPHDSLDTKDARAFIKEISSNGNINTVDVIYATFPIFYILSPEILKLLIAPIFSYMESDLYNETYAVHDLGTHYPNATGHDPEGEAMPIEESGNILILTHAYERATGNTDLSTTYASQLQQYAQYLKKDGKYPSRQLSLNDALGPIANQTNLAMKASVGLAIYGDMINDKQYTNEGHDIAHALYEGRLGTDPSGEYFTYQYGNDSWFLVYNHYGDVLFNLGLFSDEAYNATTAFYPTVRDPAGVPLQADIDWGQTNWQAYVAATVSADARDMFLSDLHAYIANRHEQNTAPFSDRYWVADHDEPVADDDGERRAGDYYRFRARPTLGSHFALWALKGGNQWSTV